VVREGVEIGFLPINNSQQQSNSRYPAWSSKKSEIKHPPPQTDSPFESSDLAPVGEDEGGVKGRGGGEGGGDFSKQVRS
jgi:hypothetical protein